MGQSFSVEKHIILLNRNKKQGLPKALAKVKND
jgi:hypothetical protein